MAKKQTELVVPQQESTAVAVPMESLGFENFDISELVVPRLRLLQGMSEAVIEGKATIGQFQDSLTGEILGDKIEIVLLGMRNGAVYFQDGKLLCKSTDGITNVNGDICKQCPYQEYYGKWNEDKPPKCSGTKEFMCITRATCQKLEQRPMLLTFMRTSYKLGRKLISMARLADMRIFACAYEISSVKEKNDKGTYANFLIKPLGKLSNDEMLEAYKWYKLLKNENIQVHNPIEQTEYEDIPI